MRDYVVGVCIVFALVSLGLAQQPSTSKPADTIPPALVKSSGSPANPQLEALLQSKIRTQWEALKKKDKTAYGELLAEDYEGVEEDGRGERNRIQAINEVINGNISEYTLWGFKLISTSADAVFLVYESTIQFPPRSVVRFSRLYIGSLWVKQKGEWKELHYQETHVK